MWIDKRQAKKDRRRISERTLFLWAWMGGSFGIWLGMNHFHHKIRKWKFQFFIPILFFFQLSFILWMAFRI